MSSESETAIHSPVGSSRPVRRVWLKRLVLAAIVVVVMLKPADWLLGVLAGSHRRHLLRLEPDAAVTHRSGEFDYVSLGLRGREVAESKPAGHRRLVVLGDSFVAGVGVADEDVFTEQLARDWSQQDVEVINVGRAGTSTIREVTLFRQIGQRFDPDVVLLVYYLGNDLAEVLEEETDEELADWQPAGTLRQLAHFWCPNTYLELAMRKRRSRATDANRKRTEAEVVAWIRGEAVASAEPKTGNCPVTVTCRPVSILSGFGTAWIPRPNSRRRHGNGPVIIWIVSSNWSSRKEQAWSWL